MEEDESDISYGVCIASIPLLGDNIPLHIEESEINIVLSFKLVGGREMLIYRDPAVDEPTRAGDGITTSERILICKYLRQLESFLFELDIEDVV